MYEKNAYQDIDASLAWDDSEEIQCVGMIPEGPNVVTFSFRSVSGKWFKFKPGQFITFELPLSDGPVFRTYTISSSPSRPLSVSVTVKAQGGSIGSSWMLKNLKPGDRLKVTGPLGIFSIHEYPSDKYLFLSAGSGVTPMMSMTSYLFDRGEEPDITFIQCANRPSELIFREALQHMASRVPSIKLHFVVSADDPFDVWSGYRGTFNSIMLSLMAQDYLEREVFCCGPEGFMDAVREILIALGYDMSRYHQESFEAPRENEIEFENDIVLNNERLSELYFKKSGKAANCSETDTILNAAKSAGLNIPSGCTFGVCGTCKIKKLSGDVHMVHNGGISEQDIASGFILACCSKPLGRVEVDL